MKLSPAFVAFRTIITTEIRKIFRVFAQTLLPPVITTTLYFLIFGHVIGQRIGTMGNLPYMQFIVPGLIMMVILNSAFSASVSLFYAYKWTRVLEEMLVSPMSSLNIVISFMTVGIVRSVIVGIIVSFIAFLFTHIYVEHIFYMLFVAILASAIFSLFGILNAIYAKSFDHISIIPTFVITPLTYLGGVFYSLSVLPSFWQKVALFDPIVYIISTFRYAFYNHTDINTGFATLIMLMIFIVLFSMCFYFIRNRIRISD
jgi:ABC-2 type transport system permease protein